AGGAAAAGGGKRPCRHGTAAARPVAVHPRRRRLGAADRGLRGADGIRSGPGGRAGGHRGGRGGRRGRAEGQRRAVRRHDSRRRRRPVRGGRGLGPRIRARRRGRGGPVPAALHGGAAARALRRARRFDRGTAADGRGRRGARARPAGGGRAAAGGRARAGGGVQRGWWLWAIIVGVVLLTAPLLAQRAALEHDNRTVEIVADLESLRELSEWVDVPVDVILESWAELGVTSAGAVEPGDIAL